MPFTATNDSRSSALLRESLHASSHEQSHGHGHGHGHASSSIVVEDGDYPSAPALAADENAWYYPSHGYGSSGDEDEDDGDDDVERGRRKYEGYYYAADDGVDGGALFSSPSAHGARDVRRSGGGGSVVARGNWGSKHIKRARWARRGKIAAWGPGMEDWQAEERARKRLKLLLSSTTTNDNSSNNNIRRSPSPSSPPTPTLPHLRSPSPPLEAPYAQPAGQHGSYVAFVLDKSITHTFRSRQLLELESATTALIEGEAILRGALGRLWQVLNDDPDRQVYAGSLATVGLGLGMGLGMAPGGGDGGPAHVNGMHVPPAPGAGGALVPKREEEEEHQQQSQSQQQKSPEEQQQQQQQQQSQAPPPQQQPIILSEDQPMLDLQEPDDEVARRLARAPDLTPTVHKLFLTFPTSSTATSAPAAPGTSNNTNSATAAPGTGSSSNTANANNTTASGSNTNSLAALEPSQFASPDGQLERLEKALATLRELQDDGREYVERLEEIREGLSAVRAQRDVIWRVVRETAIKELQEESGAVARG